SSCCRLMFALHTSTLPDRLKALIGQERFETFSCKFLAGVPVPKLVTAKRMLPLNGRYALLSHGAISRQRLIWACIQLGIKSHHWIYVKTGVFGPGFLYITSGCT